jgi:hypothetical protein
MAYRAICGIEGLTAGHASVVLQPRKSGTAKATAKEDFIFESIA